MQISLDWLMLLWVFGLIAILLFFGGFNVFLIKNKFSLSGINKTQLWIFILVFLAWSGVDIWLYYYIPQALAYTNAEGHKIQQKCIESGVCPKEPDGWTKYSYVGEDPRYTIQYGNFISARILYIPRNKNAEFGISLAYGVGEGWMATGGTKIDFMPIPADAFSKNFITGRVARLLE